MCERRAPAWGQNRGSPSPAPQFNAGAGRGAGGANGFPPLAAQANGKPGANTWGSAEDKQQLLASLAGSINTVIVVTLKSNTRFEGTLTAVSPSVSDDASLTLKNAKDLSNPQTPVKDMYKIQASNVQSFTPGSTPAANGTNKNTDCKSLRLASSNRGVGLAYIVHIRAKRLAINVHLDKRSAFIVAIVQWR